MKEKMKNYASMIVVIILIMVSIILRIPKETKYYHNQDATWHTLYTMRCYEETPISVHKFLPIVTLRSARR